MNEGDLPALVIAAQAGNTDAYAILVQRFQNMALAIGQGMLGDAHLAQDAAQDAFIDAWQSLPALREPAAFAGWFRRIVLKHCDRQLRAGRHEWPMDEARELADEISLSDSIEAIYARTRVHEAMQALSRRQQQLADLFYLQGYSQQDIVSALDLPLSSVKKGLFLARKRLREEMHDMAETPTTQGDDLAIKTQFFIALQQHDAGKVKSLLRAAPDLMDAKTEWGMLPNSNYWPLGYTALHWAAATDDGALLNVLIDGALANGADVNVRNEALEGDCAACGGHDAPAGHHEEAAASRRQPRRNRRSRPFAAAPGRLLRGCRIGAGVDGCRRAADVEGRRRPHCARLGDSQTSR